ncbi:hypothetical protein GGS20DRAFT_550376 [Poronia punctata]|nr:hypothetical protein GGS20DRAFT_550376 [Poronia punctata]
MITQWHTGEQAVQRMLGVPTSRGNPTVQGLKQAHAYRVYVSPLVAFGTLDDQGRPWVTVWGGEAGFCRPLAAEDEEEDVLVANALVDARFDPVVQLQQAARGSPQGKIMAALSIDLGTRDRLKLAGRFLAGATMTEAEGTATTTTTTTTGVANLQMAFVVEEALGNCPKYLNKKHIVPHVPSPELVSSALPLPRRALDLIGKADLFFIASKYGDDGSMDVNHRGGAPGFVRVLRNEEGVGGGGGGVLSLIYPEYSGNRLYQTLGNLAENPVAGLVIPDFETGDVLYLTGRTTILAGEQAAEVMPHAKLAVQIDVSEARFVRDGLPFRGSVIDYSPYNPPVRRLAGEVEKGVVVNTNSTATATLLNRQVLTPTISRYTFRIGGEMASHSSWMPGQHVTLDFSPELDNGYAHMRDDDPQSLNDDFVRTFTVSSSNSNSKSATGAAAEEFDIIVRKHGPATSLLAKWNMRVPLEIPVLGFGGVDDFRIVEREIKQNVFVAAGVGITPLLAQAPGLLMRKTDGRNLRVLWSLRAEDLPLAVYAFNEIGGLGSVTKLFVTGVVPDHKEEDDGDLLAEVRNLGAAVVEGRMTRNDVLFETGDERRRKYFCCTGPEMMKSLLQWTEGEEVAFESFDY